MKNLSLLFVLFTVFLHGCISSNRFSGTTLVESTALKHQKYTGQCWSFASTSLLEAEAMRLGYDIPELSSFYFVYLNYLDNAEDYFNNDGASRLKSGDLTFSVLEIFERYGAVPESIYDGGLGSLTTKRQMFERMAEENDMNALIKNSLDSLIASNASIDESMMVVENILNEYIGEVPDHFDFKGETETPKSFADRYLPLDIGDYKEITSYGHHPFYEEVILEIPTNWRYKKYLNLPIEKFINTVDDALDNGFTMAWDGDIGGGSEGGFKDNGYVRVEGEYENAKLISQEQRQSAYEIGTTQDEHNMHLVGYTYDRKGEKFYILKNTWGENRGINGFYYLSENYFRLRTISITAHKDAIPVKIREEIEM
jgi:bleomycin hydrolase